MTIIHCIIIAIQVVNIVISIKINRDISRMMKLQDEMMDRWLG